METTVTTKDLQSKLELVGRISTKHVTLPVLQCVLIECKDDRLLLKTTNLEVGIEVEIKANNQTPGVVAVPAQTLLQTINLLNQKEVTLKTTDNLLVVEGKKSNTKIKSIPYDEFPSLPTISGDGQKLQTGLFSLGIKTVVFSASLSSIKPELCSVNIFQKKPHTLTFVATDSFRLMEKTLPQKGLTIEGAFLIPQKNALEISRICDAVDEEAIIRINDNQLSLTFSDGVYITTRLTNGSFPDYEQIIPKEFITHSTVLKEDLSQAFKKTNIFLNKFFQVNIKTKPGSLVVAADNGEVGTTIETIAAETEGDELSLNFNQRYLAEPLTHLNSDSLTLKFAGVGRSMVMVPPNDETLRYLVMPMNK